MEALALYFELFLAFILYFIEVIYTHLPFIKIWAELFNYQCISLKP